jgi:hypothetical protein
MAGKTQLERAIKEIQVKRPPTDVDFTQHQLENGITVSTQERVVKEVRFSILLPLDPMPIFVLMKCPCACARGGNASAGSGPGHEHPDRRAILFQDGKGQAGHCLS